MTPETFLIRWVSIAIQRKATDLHLRFEEGTGTLELRTPKGMIKLRETADQRFLEYLKFRANLDLFLGFTPQTGHTSVLIGEQRTYLRIAYLHTLTYDHVVIRILNPPRYLKPSDLFSPTDATEILRRIETMSGLILISGSTGSGKTTTLYTLLRVVRARKIVTIEDPIEIHFPHLTQIQINPQQNLTFDTAIKQVLRHDPDIIVIGEIRDEVEAKAALRSALTGHLVISTIHARSAPLTIDRLVNFGLDRQEIINSIVIIIHQELVDDHGKKAVRYDLYPTSDHPLSA